LENQAYIFLIFILNGFLISILFDIFRILRKSFKTKDIITYIQDILFCIFTTSIVLTSIFKFTDGELRFFYLCGIAFGITLYMLIFSKVFIKINLNMMNLNKKIIIFLFVKPLNSILNKIKKNVFNLIRSILKNIKKILSLFYKNIKKMFNKKKKHECEKDLV